MYPSNMKALLLSQYNQLDIADVPAPVPGAEEILVRVAACGICGSDVHGYDGTSGRRIPPIVMGHEAAGVVAAAGAGVTRFKAGDGSLSTPPFTAGSASSVVREKSTCATTGR